VFDYSGIKENKYPLEEENVAQSMPLKKRKVPVYSDLDLLPLSDVFLKEGFGTALGGPPIISSNFASSLY